MIIDYDMKCAHGGEINYGSKFKCVCDRERERREEREGERGRERERGERGIFLSNAKFVN